uniref:Uncharacterized protein n=1 Tax=Saimiri boliviensis boliviensis TaxID=39432 RepID=A0A2K6SG06_SAIBB
MPLITTATLLKMVSRHHTKLSCSKTFSTHLPCVKLNPNTSRIINILMGQPMALVQLETLAPLTTTLQKFQTQDHMKFWKNLPLHSHHLLLQYRKL